MPNPSEPSQQLALLRHDQVVYEDQTVYVSGNAYFGCEFHRCTMVMSGGPSILSDCQFGGCIWHLNVILHDHGQATAFLGVLQGTVLPSLPSLAPAQPSAQAAEGVPSSEDAGAPA